MLSSFPFDPFENAQHDKNGGWMQNETLRRLSFCWVAYGAAFRF